MKPSLVFVTPVIPSFSGSGLAMRAADNLRALSQSFVVHLLIIRLHCGSEDAPARDVAVCCASWKVVDTPILLRESLVARAPAQLGPLADIPVAAGMVCLERGEPSVSVGLSERRGLPTHLALSIYLLPWTHTWLARGGRAWLDLDELDPRTHGPGSMLRDLGECALARRHEGVQVRVIAAWSGAFCAVSIGS